MFRFPEGPQPTSVEVPQLGERARLILEVPHWTAAVAIVDNDLRPVEGVSKLEPLVGGGEAASATVEVPAGAYNVEAKLGGHIQTMWVVAQAGYETRVPAAAWDGLELATSMPLASAIDGTPPDDPMVGEVRRLSRVTRPALLTDPGTSNDARLFLFGRLAGPSKRQGPPAWDIRLVDEKGDEAARLADHEPATDDSFWSCAFDLPKGYYVLRAREESESESFYRCQPLYLCGGWESHVFLECDRCPRLATMSFNMGRMGMGFRPDDDATVAAASLLAALADDDAGRSVSGASRMEELLRGELHNPWLGVLAAYAMSSSRPNAESDDLLAGLKRFLMREMGDHPDVRALTLSEPNAFVPLDYPPMIRAGLHRIKAYNAAASPGRDPVVTDSALAKVGDRLIADSAWTAWIEREPADGKRPAGDPESVPVKAPIDLLAEQLPSSAAVYPLGSASGAAASARPKSFAAQVAIIEAAESVLNCEGETPETVEVTLAGPLETMLNFDRETVAQIAGTGLEMVEEQFHRVADRLDQLEIPDPANAQAVQSVLAAIFDAKRCASIASIESGLDHDASAAWWFSTPVEDHVHRLRQEAHRMRLLRNDKSSLTPRESDEAGALAERLDGLAETLEGCAQLVIIADEEGHLLYGNKLLHERLQSRDDPEDVLERLHRALGGQSVQRLRVEAKELSPTSPEGKRGAMIDINRTVVHDEQGEVEGYIYLLRAADRKSLSPQESTRLDTLLPVITLHAATAQHGDADAANSLAALRDAADELDRMLSY
ncbi:MAG TPA: hypothetical protein VE053_12465 [Allosphingosinicella sp.]|nr:hypothetical protein [Allosphingosinicella sp.]